MRLFRRCGSVEGKVARVLPAATCTQSDRNLALRVAAVQTHGIEMAGIGGELIGCASPEGMLFSSVEKKGGKIHINFYGRARMKVYAWTLDTNGRRVAHKNLWSGIVALGDSKVCYMYCC